MKWTKREFSDHAPVWSMVTGPIILRVEAFMPWDWDWTVMLDGVEVAQGDVEIDHPDGAEWDHQEFEKAQARCLAVANGILLQRVREVWRDESLSAWRHIGPHSYWTIHSPDCTGPDGLDSQQTETEVLVATLEAAP